MSKHQIQIPIHSFDIDFFGHVNNLVYLRWAEIMRDSMFAEQG